MKNYMHKIRQCIVRNTDLVLDICDFLGPDNWATTIRSVTDETIEIDTKICNLFKRKKGSDVQVDIQPGEVKFSF